MAQRIANMSPRSQENGSLGPLRGVALIAALCGAAGAVALTLRAGRHNNSFILVTLFVIWVLSPFIALLWASAVSKRWPASNRATLYTLMLIITLASLAIYGMSAVNPPKSKGAFVFLLVPLGSWLLIAIAVPIAALISGRLSPRINQSPAP